MTYDNNDGPIYSVLAGKPGTCCHNCITVHSYHDGTGTCPAGFTNVMIFPGYYKCERRIYTSIGCLEDPSTANSACSATGGSGSTSGSPCP